MYDCMYVSVCVCVCVCVCMYDMILCLEVLVCMYVCMYLCVCVCLSVCMCLLYDPMNNSINLNPVHAHCVCYWYPHTLEHCYVKFYICWLV